MSRFVSFVPGPFTALCNDKEDELIHIRIQSRSDANLIAYVNFSGINNEPCAFGGRSDILCVCAAYFSSIYSK